MSNDVYNRLPYQLVFPIPNDTLCSASMLRTGLPSLALSSVTFDPVKSSKTACLALKPPGFPALKQLELRGANPEVCSCQLPTGGCRRNHGKPQGRATTEW
jgi:hypothetical protein